MPGILDNIKKFVEDSKVGKVSLKSAPKNISALKPGDIIVFRYVDDGREAIEDSQLAPNVPEVPVPQSAKGRSDYNKFISSNVIRRFSGLLAKVKGRKHIRKERHTRWKRSLLKRPHRVALVVGGYVNSNTRNKLVSCFVLVEGAESKVNSVIMEMAVNKLYNRRNIKFSRRLLQGIKALFNAEDYRTFNLFKMENIHNLRINKEIE